MHDESVYGPDASAFRPERYLEADLPYPEVAFGYGRRICPGKCGKLTPMVFEFTFLVALPGQYLARDSIWIAIVSVLATCDITKAVDEHGKVIEPTDDCVSGIVA